jgi:hypothetical protein
MYVAPSAERQGSRTGREHLHCQYTALRPLATQRGCRRIMPSVCYLAEGRQMCTHATAAALGTVVIYYQSVCPFTIALMFYLNLNRHHGYLHL